MVAMTGKEIGEWSKVWLLSSILTGNVHECNGLKSAPTNVTPGVCSSRDEDSERRDEMQFDREDSVLPKKGKPTPRKEWTVFAVSVATSQYHTG